MSINESDSVLDKEDDGNNYESYKQSKQKDEISDSIKQKSVEQGPEKLFECQSAAFSSQMNCLISSEETNSDSFKSQFDYKKVDTKVLLVDDQPFNLNVLEVLILEKFDNVSIFTALNGQQAVDMVKE